MTTAFEAVRRDLHELRAALATLTDRAAAADDVLSLSRDVAALKAAPPPAAVTVELDPRVDALAAQLTALSDTFNRHTHAPTPSRLPPAVLGGFRAVAMVLAVRYLMVMALAGTFTLAVMAMQNQTLIGLGLTIAFALLTLAPLAVIDVRQRPTVPEPTP